MSEISLRELTEGDPDWYSYQDKPHPLPSRWKQYFEGLLSYPLLIQAVQISPYIDLMVVGESRLLQERIDEFLSSPGLRTLLIRGHAGSGKSTFVRRLTCRLADGGLETIQAIMNREEFVMPPGPIPFYHALQGTGLEYKTRVDLTRRLLDGINSFGRFWNEQPKKPEWLLENPELQWVLMLDGLDEIWSTQHQRAFLDSLRGFIDLFPTIKVILTSRPHSAAIDPGLLCGEITEIAALTDKQIIEYVTTSVNDNEPSTIVEALRGHQELWRLSRLPAYLVAAMAELSDTDFRQPTDQPANVLLADSNDQTSGMDYDAPVLGVKTHSSTLLQAVSADELRSRSDAQIDVPIPIASRDTASAVDDSGVRIRTVLPGLVADKIYSYLWARELNRRSLVSAEAEEWLDGTGRLALKTDGLQPRFRRDTALKILRAKSALQMLLSMGVLAEAPGNVSSYSFFTDLTKHYFAARLIKTYLETNDIEAVKPDLARCTDEFRRHLCEILADITQQDISTICQTGGS